MLTQFIRDTFAGMPAAVRPLAMLAGGALRAQFDGTEVKDRDLFFRNDADYQTAYKAFLDESFGDNAVFEIHMVDSAERYPAFVRKDDGRVYQLIGLYFHERPTLLAQSFDFRCCAMVAWEVFCTPVCPHGCPAKCSEFELFCAPGSTQDAELLQLVPQVRQSDERIEKRVARYAQRGYRKCDGFAERLARMPVVSSGY